MVAELQTTETLPTWFTEELFNKTIDAVCAGKTLKQTARELGFSEVAWRRLICRNNELATRYAFTREQQAEAWSDEIIDVADQCEKDSIIDENGKARFDTEWFNRSKLRIDTRKWLMAKLHPKKYGDHIQVDQTITHEAGDSIAKLLGSVRQKRETIEAEIVPEIAPQIQDGSGEEWVE